MLSLKNFQRKIEVSRYNKKCKKWNKAVRSQICECGDSLQVFGDVEIACPQRLTVGNNCKINSRVYINALSGVEIGDGVTLSYGVKILSTGYDVEKWLATGEKAHAHYPPVYIGNNCWVGAGATILPGVKITGEYVIIGADSVVTKDVTESRVVLAGSPARIIKRL